MRWLVFDIETRIDKALVRDAFFRHEQLTEEEAYERMRSRLLEETEGRSEFFPLTCHVPISIVIGSVDDSARLTDLETLAPEGTAEDLARAFWARLESSDATLVSFNGRGFDLPVLELQAFRYAIPAPRYFGEPRGPRNRYGDRHCDVFDVLTNYGAHRLRGGLDLMARLTDLPGKSGVDGSQVQTLWETGRRDDIHRYCRRDVIQTYFVWLRLEVVRGRLSREAYEAAIESTAVFRREMDSQ